MADFVAKIKAKKMSDGKERELDDVLTVTGFGATNVETLWEMGLWYVPYPLLAPFCWHCCHAVTNAVATPLLRPHSHVCAQATSWS